MRSRLPISAVLVIVLLFGVSGLDLVRPARVALAQFPTPTDILVPSPTTPATTVPTNTPTSMIPTFTPTVTTVPPGTASPQPTSPPGGQPEGGGGGRPVGPPATPSIGIAVGNCVQSVGAEGVILGSGPGFDFGHVQIVNRDKIVFVLEGPERADGFWWWRVQTSDGVEGWGINDQMFPYNGACFASATATTVPATVFGAARGTSGRVSELPSTGTNATGLIFAGALASVLVIVGLLRRRNQGSA